MKITNKNIDNIIQKIPVKIEGNFKGFTIILFIGAGGNIEEWNNINLKKFYNNIKKDWCNSEKYKDKFEGILNFQTELSKITQTFSFTPIEFLLSNNYENKKENEPIEPNNYFFSLSQIEYTMKYLIELHKLKGPFFLIGFSEGGWRALYLQNKINCIGCLLIDPQRYNKNTPENIDTFENGYKIMTKEILNSNVLISKKSKDYIKTKEYDILIKQLSYYKYKNMINKFKLEKFKCPIHVLLNLQEIGEEDYTRRFLSDCEFVSNLTNNGATFHIYFDEIHALHLLYHKEIVKYIKTFLKEY